MNYLETLAYIDSLSPTLERPSLTRVSTFIAESDAQVEAAATRGEGAITLTPQFPVFHIGGTNGKGSTAAILDSLLRRAGFKVGRFTGPHLLRWNERFHVDGTAISDDEFARLSTIVRARSHDFAGRHADLGPLTWFEFLTAIAFLYFAEQKVDVAVLEVGLGGRFDSTNVVTNVLCSAITNIDLDHTHILGETEEAIAFEKAGIFKHGIPAVTAALTGPALDTLIQRAADVGAPLHICSAPGNLVLASDNSAAPRLEWSEYMRGFASAASRLNLLGGHQRMNALVAVSCLYLAAKNNREFGELIEEHLLAQPDAFADAFSDVYWPGRLHPLKREGHVFLDGAHNPAGARTLRAALDELYPDENRCFVLTCFANKNAHEMLSSLIRQGDQVFLSEAATRRATVSKEELATVAEQLGARPYIFETVSQAFASALEKRNPEQPVVATGSFATVREVMTLLGWHRVEDGQQALPDGITDSSNRFSCRSTS